MPSQQSNTQSVSELTLNNKKQSEQKLQLSIDGYRRLRRARHVAHKVGLHPIDHENDAMSSLWLHYIFSYICDDIQFVTDELNEMGLFDDYLNHSK